MKSESLDLRYAVQSDIKGMVNLLSELFQIEDDFSFNEEKQYKGLSLLVNDKSCAVLVASINKKIVGMVTIQILVSTAEGGNVGIIEDLVLKKEHRRQKIASKLLDKAFRWANENSLKRIQLLADKNNSGALAFYSKTDWQKTNLICLRKFL